MAMVPPFRPQRSQLHFIPKNVGGRACSCRACNVACLCGGCAMFTAFSHPLPQSHPLCTSHSGYNPSTNHLATSHIQSTLLIFLNRLIHAMQSNGPLHQVFTYTSHSFKLHITPITWLIQHLCYYNDNLDFNF